MSTANPLMIINGHIPEPIKVTMKGTSENRTLPNQSNLVFVQQNSNVNK